MKTMKTMKTLNKLAIAGALVAGLSACDLNITAGPSLTCNDPQVIGTIQELAMDHYISRDILSMFPEETSKYSVEFPMGSRRDETTGTFSCSATLSIEDVPVQFGGGDIYYRVVEGDEEFSVEVRGL